MKSPVALLATFGLAIGAWFFWNQQQPETQVKATVEQFLGAMENRKISTKNRDETERLLTEVLTENISVEGDDPIPDADLTRAQFFERVNTLHSLSSLIEIKIIKQEVAVIAKEAQATVIIDATAAMGPSYKTSGTWKLTLDLVNDEDWRIRRISGRKAD